MVALTVAAGVGIAWGFHALGAAPTLTADSTVQLARSSAVLGSVTVKFSSRNARPKSENGHLTIAYDLVIENDGPTSTSWKPTEQGLRIEGEELLMGSGRSARIASHREKKVRLSFDLDEDQQPITLELQVGGKRSTINVKIVPATETTPTPTTK